MSVDGPNDASKKTHHIDPSLSSSPQCPEEEGSIRKVSPAYNIPPAVNNTIRHPELFGRSIAPINNPHVFPAPIKQLQHTFENNLYLHNQAYAGLMYMNAAQHGLQGVLQTRSVCYQPPSGGNLLWVAPGGHNLPRPLYRHLQHQHNGLIQDMSARVQALGQQLAYCQMALQQAMQSMVEQSHLAQLPIAQYPYLLPAPPSQIPPVALSALPLLAAPPAEVFYQPSLPPACSITPSGTLSGFPDYKRHWGPGNTHNAMPSIGTGFHFFPQPPSPGLVFQNPLNYFPHWQGWLQGSDLHQPVPELFPGLQQYPATHSHVPAGIHVSTPAPPDSYTEKNASPTQTEEPFQPIDERKQQALTEKEIRIQSLQRQLEKAQHKAKHTKKLASTNEKLTKDVDNLTTQLQQAQTDHQQQRAADITSQEKKLAEARESAEKLTADLAAAEAKLKRLPEHTNSTAAAEKVQQLEKQLAEAAESRIQLQQQLKDSKEAYELKAFEYLEQKVEEEHRLEVHAQEKKQWEQSLAEARQQSKQLAEQAREQKAQLVQAQKDTEAQARKLDALQTPGQQPLQSTSTEKNDSQVAAFEQKLRDAQLQQQQLHSQLVEQQKLATRYENEGAVLVAALKEAHTAADAVAVAPLRKKLNSAGQVLAEQESFIENLNKKQEENNDRIIVLEQQLHQANRAIEEKEHEYEKQLDAWRAFSEEAVNTADELKKENNQLNDEYTKQQKHIQQLTLQNRVLPTTGNAPLFEQTTDSPDHETQYSSLLVELTLAQKEINEQKEKIAQLNIAHAHQLEQLNTALTQEKTDNRQTIKEREQQHAQLTQLASDLKNTQQELQTEKESLKKELQRYTDKAEVTAKLQVDLDKARAERNDALKKYEQKSQQIIALNTQLSALENQKNTLNENLKNNDTIINQQNERLLSLQQSSKELQRQLSEHIAVKEQLQALQQEHDRVKAQHTSLAEDQRSRSKQAETISQLQSHLEQLEAHITETRSECAQQQQLLNAAQSNLDKNNTEHAATLNTVLAEIDALQQTHEHMQETGKHKIEELYQQLTKNKSEADAYKAKISAQKKQLVQNQQLITEMAEATQEPTIAPPRTSPATRVNHQAQSQQHFDTGKASAVERPHISQKQVTGKGQPQEVKHHATLPTHETKTFAILKKHCAGHIPDQPIINAVEKGFRVDESTLQYVSDMELCTYIYTFLKRDIQRLLPKLQKSENTQAHTQHQPIPPKTSTSATNDKQPLEALYQRFVEALPPDQSAIADIDTFPVLLLDIDLNTVDLGKFINALQNFRILQKYQHKAGVTLSDTLFSTLFMCGALDENPESFNLPTDISPQDRQLLLGHHEQNKIIKAYTAFVTACQYKDFDPDVTAEAYVAKAGLRPSGNGLYNWSNMCFINSGMQLLAHTLSSAHLLGPLSEGIPLSAAIGIVERKMPDILKTFTERQQWAELSTQQQQEKIQDIAQQCIQHTLNVISNNEPYPLGEELRKYFECKNSFIELCQQLTDPASVPKTLVQQQKQFLQLYLQLSTLLGRPSARSILNANDSASLLPAKIPQQDPEEFMRDIMDIFGINVHEECSFSIVDTKQLSSSKGDIHAHAAPVIEPPGAILPIQASNIERPSLQDCLTRHLEAEYLDTGNQFEWPEALLKKHALTKSQAKTKKQLALMKASDSLPKQIIFQLKIFNNDGQKLGEKGRQVLENLQDSKQLHIPVIHSPDNTQPSENFPYTVRSVVCHRGEKSTSGHYLTVRFEGDKVIIYDDDVVLDMASYARFYGREPYRDFRDFCQKEKLSGYLYSLTPTEAHG